MSDKQDIRAVVIDLDGTLLNNQHQLSDGNKEAIRQAIEQGVQVVLATGKTRTSAEPVIAALGLQTPGVFVQGLILYNADGTIRQERKLEPDIARRAIQYAEADGFEVIVYSGDRLVASQSTPAVREIAKFGEPMPEAIGSLINHVNSLAMHKLIIVGGTQRKLNALRWRLQQQIGDSLTFTTGGVLVSLEVLPKKTGKGNGVKALLRQMGMKPDQVMAIGDAPNDVEMLKLVGLPVAVENADESVKAVAQEIVGSNDDDGVAEALKKFVLKQAEPATDISTTQPDSEIGAAPTDNAPTDSGNSASTNSTLAAEDEKTSTEDQT